MDTEFILMSILLYIRHCNFGPKTQWPQHNHLQGLMITMDTITMIMEATDMTITMEEDTEKIMGTATKKRPIVNVIAKIRNVMDIIAKKN